MRRTLLAGLAVTLVVTGGCSRLPAGSISSLQAPAYPSAEEFAALAPDDLDQADIEALTRPRRAKPHVTRREIARHPDRDVTSTASIVPEAESKPGQGDYDERRLNEAFERGATLTRSICSGC